MSALQTDWPGILLAYSAYVVATLSPGPAMLATVGTSMNRGRKPGVTFALGLVAGSFCWAASAAVGLSALLAAYAGALTALKVVGGLYLLWLAYKSFRSAASPREAVGRMPNGPAHGAGGYFLRGWTVQVTNPKSVLGWIAIISLGLRPGAPAWVFWVIVGGTTLFAIFFYTLCAVAFSTAPVVRLYGGARRWIDAVLGTFFTVAACKLLADR